MMDKIPGELERKNFGELAANQAEGKKQMYDDLFRKLDGQVKKVTPELFAKFLNERGASRTCLSCGSNKLAVPETAFLDETKLPEGYLQLPFETRMNLQSAAMSKYVSYSFIEKGIMPHLSNVQYTVHCWNCGFISHYRAYPAAMWVIGQEEEGTDE